jgi:hypothetical protein
MRAIRPSILLAHRIRIGFDYTRPPPRWCTQRTWETAHFLFRFFLLLLGWSGYSSSE